MSDPGPARRIELLETLGKGGFGAVYLADVHGRDDFVQRLAVKVLSEEMHAHDDIAARQRDEARLLARLNHDHIVRVMDLTELGGRPAVLMEYVEGADAGELLRQGRLPPRAALQICAAAASALDAAWNSPGPRTGQPLRVIHRDIKPANLLVSRHGGVKVLDFGVARAEFDREGRTGSVQFGTARFMAPEQWLYGEASHKVDVYALGVSMVELLTGMHLKRPPLEPSAFAAHVDEVRAAVHRPEWSDGFATGLDALVWAMLAFEPGDRPDAGDAFEALAHLVEAAPGEGLRRYARRVVPPIIAARRERWADEPVPQLTETGRHRVVPAPAPVDPDTAAMVQVVETATRSAPGPAPADAPPADDTLAADRPAPRGRPAALVVGVAVAVAAVVVAGGVGAARLVLGEEEATAEVALPTEVASAAEVGPVAEVGALGEDLPGEDLPGEDLPGEDLPGEDLPGEDLPGEDLPGEVVPTAAASVEPRPAPRGAGSADTSDRASPPARPTPPGSEPAPLPAAEPDSTGGPASQPSAPTAAVAVAPVQTASIRVSSAPWGAEVWIDGALVGRTPLPDLRLSTGPHELVLRHGEHETRQQITVGGRHPTSYAWTAETDAWRTSH